MSVFLHKQILPYINACKQHANLKKIQLKRKIHRAFSISVPPADWRILFLGAATGLHDDDSEFGRFTTECFTLWEEIPA